MLTAWLEPFLFNGMDKKDTHSSAVKKWLARGVCLETARIMARGEHEDINQEHNSFASCDEPLLHEERFSGVLPTCR